MNVQIAREASLVLIRERLLSAENPNPSFKDAHQHISDNLEMGANLASFLEAQHDLWVTIKHPLNNLELAWIPQLMADDFYRTYKSLVHLYRYLLLEA